MWYFPQYHILIFFLVILAISLMIVILCLLIVAVYLLFKILKRADLLLAAHGLAACPNCHKETMVMRYANPGCRCILVSRAPKPVSVLSPTPAHGIGD